VAGSRQSGTLGVDESVGVVPPEDIVRKLVRELATNEADLVGIVVLGKRESVVHVLISACGVPDSTSEWPSYVDAIRWTVENAHASAPQLPREVH
jgi:hypothetical protein